MGGEGRLATLGSIEWQIAHQHIAQQRVADDLAQYVVDATQLVFGVQRRSVTISHPQTVERRGRSHLLHQAEVTVQVVALSGKVAGQRLDELLTAIGKAELLSLQRHDIVARRVETAQADITRHVKIAQQASQYLSLIGTPNEVHTRLELHPVPMKALQAATHLRPLFEHGDVIAVTTQYQAARQASEAAAYDDYLLHLTSCRSHEYISRRTSCRARSSRQSLFVRTSAGNAPDSGGASSW